jgi:hypothetical protein
MYLNTDWCYSLPMQIHDLVAAINKIIVLTYRHIWMPAVCSVSPVRDPSPGHLGQKRIARRRPVVLHTRPCRRPAAPQQQEQQGDRFSGHTTPQEELEQVYHSGLAARWYCTGAR